jgi:hypothetical protein
MNFITNLIVKGYSKLYVKQWVIGLAYGDIKEIIRSKTFDQKIKWLPVDSIYHFYGDPFLHRSEDGNLNILFEDFAFDDNYGNISILTLDKDLNKVEQKILLDTGSHLSYPFIFKENNKNYIFPEASRSGVLTCYEFDSAKKSLHFLKEIIKLPLLDSTILKYNNKYWLFGTLNDAKAGYMLYVYFSDNLLGPYVPHPANPVKKGMDGTRSAGHFIEVDGNIYRPTQNCANAYGESITINKLSVLNEYEVMEETYMNINIDDYNWKNHGIHTIHTINSLDGIVAVDGIKWTFSMQNQWKNFQRNRKLEKLKRAGATN